MPVIAAVAWLGARAMLAGALVVTSWALGRRLTRGVEYGGALERYVVASALGLAALGGGLFLLGLAGWLNRWTVAGLVALVHLLARQEWRRALTVMAGVRTHRPWSARRAMAGTLVAIAFAPVILLPLYPATEYDALAYHLPYARGFVATGEMPFFDELVYPFFPPHQELLFAGMMLFGDDVDAQLVSLFELALVALLIACWARRTAGNRAGALGAALWLGTPLAIWHGGTALVDLGQALFGGLSLYAWRRWRGEEGPGGRNWMLLAAAFAAAAAAGKYLGLFFAGFIGLVLVAAVLDRVRRRHALCGLLLLVGLAAPWYLRIWAVTGSPLFPFYPKLLGSSAWAEANQGRGRAVEYAPGDVVGLALAEAEKVVQGLDALARAPYDMVFERQRYNNQAPISPWLLVLLPSAGVVALLRAEGRRLLLPVGLYGLAWLITTREPRFLLAVFPPLMVALALGLEQLRKRWRWAGSGLVATVLAVVLALPGPAYALYKLVERGEPVPLTPQSRVAYLEHRVPGFGAVAWLDQRFGAGYTAYAWHAPWLAYHGRGRVLGALFGPYRYRSVAMRQRRDRTWSLRQLRSFGAGHVIVTTDWSGRRQSLPPGLAPRLEQVAAGPGWRVLALRPDRGRTRRPGHGFAREPYRASR